MATPNALFAIFSLSNPAVFETRVAGAVGWLSYALPEKAWLVIAPSATTSKEVSDRLGITSGESSGVVVRFESYFGRINPAVWEWIATKQGAELWLPNHSLETIRHQIR